MTAKQHPKFLASSIRGALHKAKGLPCQDYCAAKIKNNKVVAVVSDGAGSAPYSQIGARIVCQTLCDVLINANMKNIKEKVVAAIETAREKLVLHRCNKSKTTDDLISFAATIIGFFWHKDRGIFFHIGDGAGLAYQQGNYDHFIISEPENGAFSCETFFYTMDDWQSCLRFEACENVDRVMLMTDGVTGFVFADDFYKLQQKFFVPVAEYLEQESDHDAAIKALSNTLNDSRAQRLNADDKTILWIKLR